MRVTKNSFYYVLPFLIFLLIFIFWQRSPANLESGQSVPTFNLPILYHSEKRFTNEDLKGKITLVNFWASWCSACIKEHPVLMWAKEKHNISILGIDYLDNEKTAKLMLKKIGNPYSTIAVDSEGILGNQWDVNMIPQTFLIDTHGKIIYRHIGILSQRELENKILPIIQQTQK